MIYLSQNAELSFWTRALLRDLNTYVKLSDKHADVPAVEKLLQTMVALIVKSLFKK